MEELKKSRYNGYLNGSESWHVRLNQAASKNNWI